MARMQHSNLPSLMSAQEWECIANHELAQEFAKTELNAQTHSRGSSSNSLVSDTSPISLTFSERTRRSDSSSSVASNPILLDASDIFISAKKSLPALPDVQEDPREKEEADLHLQSSNNSVTNSPKVNSARDSGDSVWGVRPSSFYAATDKYYDEFYVANDDHVLKRRKSDDPPMVKEANQSLAARLVSRMPSLSRRVSSRKGPSSGTPELKSETPKFLSRANSFRKSMRARSQETSISSIEARQTAAPIETIVEDGDLVSSPTELFTAIDASYFDDRPVVPLEQSDQFEQPEQDIIRSTTPLLPALLESLKNVAPVQSPLTSPTVAAYSHIAVSPLLCGPASPPLSTQPSTASFGRSRAPTLLSSASEIPPLVIADKEDPMSDQLGHADFTIFPQPYCPEVCDMHAINEVTNARQRARDTFAGHLNSTANLFGFESKVYNLTREKWAAIDVEWQQCLDEMMRRAFAQGQMAMPMTPLEPAPIIKQSVEKKSAEIKRADLTATVISDPKIRIGVEEILGPMAVSPPQIQPETKLDQLKRVFSFTSSGRNTPRVRSP